MTVQILKAEEYYIKDEPYYEAIGNEIDIFEACIPTKAPCVT